MKCVISPPKKKIENDRIMRVPIKSWCGYVEPGALEQAFNLASLPFVYKWVALMPDCHQGYGMPIGGVIATKGVVIPNAVGVDIGCGMCALKTSLTDIDKETLKRVLGKIREDIPTGFNHHEKMQDEGLMPLKEEGLVVVLREFASARTQIGTLGGGNHFIEIQKGSDGHIWIMVHSGSRNIGYKTARYYNDIAKKLNERWFSKVPKEYDLAFLPLDSIQAKAYLVEMQYCVNFALANRKLMMARIGRIFVEVVDITVKFDEMINIAHNYASMENHFGQNVMVHRKGATLARKGTIGIIPGSQGTNSYIVKGLGNKDSFESCSHGAGRVMSRKKAKETLNLKEEQKRLDDKGILHSIRGQKDLDEAPSSYKDIDEVMESQNDLVEILVELKPLAVVKGE